MQNAKCDAITINRTIIACIYEEERKKKKETETEREKETEGRAKK